MDVKSEDNNYKQPKEPKRKCACSARGEPEPSQQFLALLQIHRELMQAVAVMVEQNHRMLSMVMQIGPDDEGEPSHYLDGKPV